MCRHGRTGMLYRIPSPAVSPAVRGGGRECGAYISAVYSTSARHSFEMVSTSEPPSCSLKQSVWCAYIFLFPPVLWRIQAPPLFSPVQFTFASSQKQAKRSGGCSQVHSVSLQFAFVGDVLSWNNSTTSWLSWKQCLKFSQALRV